MMLKDRVAIVTGAARGIGQEYSLGLVREGAKVVVTDLLSCDETAAKVRQAGGDVLALKTDVTSEQSTRAMAEETDRGANMRRGERLELRIGPKFPTLWCSVAL